MKIHYVILPALALGGAAALLLPARSEAFTTIGGSLGTSQRDMRVFNNFTDASANDNLTIDSQFPGWTGVNVAMWKACVEWGSRLHGNGNGDPHQNAGLGSGGANFDSIFTGAANGVGGVNENIVSELPGSDGGVLAFTETPISDGWRIRFYAGWTWADGPTASIPGSQIDIQGVMCHEYGHALGLGHTTVSGSTMLASITGTGVPQRSIGADDIAGVQSIYGVASATKPIISSVSSSPGFITINGSGFSASGNQVWFTQSGTNTSGDAAIVSNVTSSGTSITVAVPANGGSGDVMVKMNATGNSSLSNAFPFNEDTGPTCNPPINYCFTAPNSFDPNGAVIGYSGTQSVAANDFVLLTTGVPPNAAGIYFFGLNQTFASFGNGFRCVGSPLFRLPIINANGFGDAVFNLNLLTPPALGNINSGEIWNFQFWYRNPLGGGAGFNLSDGLQVPFCP